jgi:uncharacterized protein (DUF2336 family)
LLCGNLGLFEETLSELSGMPLARVRAIVHDRSGGGFRALYEKARLPISLYPAFREVIEAMQEPGFISDAAGAIRLKRRMIERVLTRCADTQIDDIEPLLTLLRRFATEAAREEARRYCDEIAGEVSAVSASRHAA